MAFSLMAESFHDDPLIQGALKKLESIIESPPLTYSRATPTVPGFYWCRGRNSDGVLRVCVCEVFESAGEPCFFAWGATEPTPCRLLIADWAGPLALPAEPGSAA